MSYSFQNFEADSEFLYRYFQDLRKFETESGYIVEHFRDLFIHGLSYADPDVLRTIYRLVDSSWIDEEFHNILNRCCHIFINHWWLQSELKFKQATYDLVALFEQSSPLPSPVPVVQKLRSLTRQFVQTPQYEILQRYARVAGYESEPDDRTEAEFMDSDVDGERLSDLIHRYPCLYRFYIQDTTSNHLGRKAIKQQQIYQERKFQQDLFSFAAVSLFPQSTIRETHPSRTVANPTLLTEQQVRDAVQMFVGPVKGAHTFRDSALHFAKDIRQASSLYEVKEQLHDYLGRAIDHRTFHKCFDDWLHGQLRDTLPQQNHLKPKASLVLRACNQLVEAIITSPDFEPQKHVFFLSLHGNVGTTSTIGLLLKIVLLCQALVRNPLDILESIKARVSRQFASLFRYYEDQFRGQAQWLIECLDNLMIAFAIHAGHDEYSQWKSLLNLSHPLRQF
ncbi:MAG: hypothetical protein WCA35_26575 [Kovacikia sp.]